MSNSGITRRAALTGAAAALPLIGGMTTAQAKEQSDGFTGRRVPADVAKMLREISAANIQRTIEKLVTFGTRNTLSSQTDPTRGIGAARDWLFDEFKKAALPVAESRGSRPARARPARRPDTPARSHRPAAAHCDPAAVRRAARPAAGSSGWSAWTGRSRRS